MRNLPRPRLGACALDRLRGRVTATAASPPGPASQASSGRSPEYLVAAMKAYVTGQRKHVMMKTLLSGLGDAEINNIAFYYARQAPAQAQTPPVGDPAAGRAATGLCANCHGERGISVSPAFPSLAGQDALYLADALREYRDGSRNKTIACAGCHGDSGISRKSGIPSLVGLDAQYLRHGDEGLRDRPAQERRHEGAARRHQRRGTQRHCPLLCGASSARAQTPSVGDAAAGRAASAACAGCHGEQGVSTNPAWPSLAGQDARYLADTLRYYKDGSRSDEIMKGLAASLDEQTINNLASYYAGLAPGQPHPVNGAAKHDPVLVRNGLVSGLDDRTINNIASYYASLAPAQSEIAKNVPARPVPAVVLARAPGEGLSVGGIISYRKNDPGRTAEENNAICLACHERGERTLWQGSVHEDARSRLRELPYHHEERVAQEPTENGVRAGHLLPVPQGSARADVPLVAHAAA